jgi:hypothetical protein
MNFILSSFLAGVATFYLVHAPDRWIGPLNVLALCQISPGQVTTGGQVTAHGQAFTKKTVLADINRTAGIH